ncbi:MAG: hypothetical protein ABI609_16140 [Acidobacteriota bacterium]
MTTWLIPLAAWVVALKLANDDEDRNPLILGAIAGAVFALFSWLEVIVSHAQLARALVATPLYVCAGALLVKLFSRVEGIFSGVVIVIVGTLVMFGFVPRVVDAVVPGRQPQTEHASRLPPNPALNRTSGLAPSRRLTPSR